jgi:hypothetical protein
MTGRLIRGRRRIAYELGASDRTVSRRAASGLLDVSCEPAKSSHVMVLDAWQPLGLAAGRVMAKLFADESKDRARST